MSFASRNLLSRSEVAAQSGRHKFCAGTAEDRRRARLLALWDDEHTLYSTYHLEQIESDIRKELGLTKEEPTPIGPFELDEAPGELGDREPKADGMTIEAIGEELGISTSMVCEIMKQALAKLHRALEALNASGKKKAVA